MVAIDGPSGSGKSSVSKEVARRLKLAYLDTGAMYRALTWFCLDSGTDLDDAAAVEHAAEEPAAGDQHQPAGGVRAGRRHRRHRWPSGNRAISAAVSAVATTLGARTELIRRQRELIEKHHRRMVVEGRDITTVVAPGAEVRMLLTASEEARLRRRGIQLGGTPERRAAGSPGHPPRRQGLHRGELHHRRPTAWSPWTPPTWTSTRPSRPPSASWTRSSTTGHCTDRATVTTGAPDADCGTPRCPAVDHGVEPARGLAPGPRRLPDLGHRPLQRPGGRAR